MANQLSVNAYSQLRIMSTLYGLANILFGLALLLWPQITYSIMTAVFWLFMFVVGAIQIYAAIRIGIVVKSGSWPLLIIAGLIEIAGGIYFLNHLDQAFLSVQTVFAIILTSKALIAFIMLLDPHLSTRQKLLIVGIGALSLIFAILFFGLSPDNATDAAARVLGVYALGSGVLRFLLGQGFKQELNLLLSSKKSWITYNQEPVKSTT